MHLWRIPYSTHNGLQARAAPGTHEAVASEVAALSLSNDSRVADLAAGTGALLSRIGSLGYGRLTAIERDVGQFGLPGLTPISLDLNKPFHNLVPDQFDLITAVEIIEHLDCPRHFLSEVYESLAPGGHAIITTPNAAHWLSRLQFLLTGNLKYFTAQDFHDQRHISPILDLHMRIMLEEVGFTLLKSYATASSWGLLIRMVTSPVSWLFRCTSSGDVDGNINLYVVRK